MATITPQPISGAADGLGVLVTGTNSAGADLIHTATATGTQWDEITLWAHNTDTQTRELTVEFGEAANPMVVPIPHDDGAYLMIQGWRLRNGKTVKVFASAANVVKVAGRVNRYDSA